MQYSVPTHYMPYIGVCAELGCFHIAVQKGTGVGSLPEKPDFKIQAENIIGSTLKIQTNNSLICKQRASRCLLKSVIPGTTDVKTVWRKV